VTERASPRARLEALLSPDLLTALDDYISEVVEERLGRLPDRDGREWFTLEEAAQQLGCSYEAVRKRAKRGRLETRRHGRTVLVSARSLAAL
jgi:excisionase family DNA binding protein